MTNHVGRSGRLPFRTAALLALILCVAGAAAGSSPAARAAAMTNASFWASHAAPSPAVPLVGDLDGDGHADLITVQAAGAGQIVWTQTSPLGRPISPRVVRNHFGPSQCVASACGAFLPLPPGKARPAGGRTQVLAVFPDGEVRVASDFGTGTTHDQRPLPAEFRRDDLVAAIPLSERPYGPAHCAVGEFEGDGRLDVLILDAGGRLLLLRNECVAGGPPRFLAQPLVSQLPGVSQVTACTFSPARSADLVWMDAAGQVFRAALGLTAVKTGVARLPTLGAPVAVCRAAPGDGLVGGYYRGRSTEDLLVGQRLLPGGDAGRAVTLPNLPSAALAHGDAAWIGGDFDGDGRDDLIRIRRSSDFVIGDDALIHFSHVSGDGLVGYASSAGDGLPDLWKTGRVRPGGLDLKAMGCSPAHQDVLVEVQRSPDVSDGTARRLMARVTRYFAGLPTRNPDGTHGIAFHVLWRDPLTPADRSATWDALGHKYHASALRGVTHWMALDPGTTGKAFIMGQEGHCRPSFGNFLHEFGHQLGLSHAGGLNMPERCPLYHSVMNYCYLAGRADAVAGSDSGGADVDSDLGYSDGALAPIVLNERHLAKRVPVPINRLQFLAHSPAYHFAMQATADGRATLIDWNRDGVLGEDNVAADINYSCGAAGAICLLCRTDTSPALVTVGGDPSRLALFCAFHGRLGVRCSDWGRMSVGREAWSAEVPVEAAPEVIGCPSAAADGKGAWVAYATASGVQVCPVSFGITVQVGPPVLIPGSAGAAPKLVSYADGLALVLWRGPRVAVGLRLLRVNGVGLLVGSERSLALTSKMPAEAAVGGVHGRDPLLWTASVESGGQTPSRPDCWVSAFALNAGGPPVFRERTPVTVATSDIQCPRLAWEGTAANVASGRLTLCGTSAGEINGRPGGTALWTQNFGSAVGLWQPGIVPPDLLPCSNPVACASGSGTVWAACRTDPQGQEMLVFERQDRGLDVRALHDFDDIGFISAVGLSHSLPYVVR